MKSLGIAIEQQAKRFLVNQGLRFITSNFHSRFGEIDLIMLDNHTLCFIEVKHRKGAAFGSAAESITSSKQQKIVKTAEFFLLKNQQYHDAPIRFDAVLSQGTGHSSLKWIKNAFTL